MNLPGKSGAGSYMGRSKFLDLMALRNECDEGENRVVSRINDWVDGGSLNTPLINPLELHGAHGRARKSLQKIRTEQWVEDSENPLPLVVILASNRTSFRQNAGSIRHQLAYLLRRMPKGSSSTIPQFDPLADAALNAPRIIVADSVRKSEVKADDSNVSILDGWSLARSFISTPWRFMSSFLPGLRVPRSTKTMQGGALLPLPSKVDTLLLSSMKQVLDGLGRFRAVSLTSNSRLPELWREAALNHPGCSQFVEVMHGAGSVPAESFFSRYDAYSKSNRLVYSPLVPTLPSSRSFEPRLVDADGHVIAVNSYTNFQRMVHLNSGTWNPEWMLGQVLKVLPGGLSPSASLVAFLGNYSNRGPEGNDASIQAELCIMRMIQEEAKVVGVDIQIAYVPHPNTLRLQANSLKGIPRDIGILQSSFAAFLCADLCASIQSSTLFESQYLGIPTLTPLVPSDGIYSRNYLASLIHPDGLEREDFRRAIRTWLSQTTSEAKSRFETVRGRMDLF